MIDTGPMIIPDKLLIYFDETYGPSQSQDYLTKTKDLLCLELSIRGVDYEMVNAEELLGRIQEDISLGTLSFKLLFTAGAIPDIIYDCTTDSPLMKWLEQGGVLYWANGVIGRDVSVGMSITECDGYGQLFFGIPDSNIGTGAHGYIYASEKSLHFDRLRNLGIIYNDCTYGINTESITDEYLSIGYTAEGLDSLVLSKYHNGEGMIVNFGGRIATNSVPVFAEVIASKITYNSQIVHSEGGRLLFSEVKGDIAVDSAKNYVLYVWIGYPVRVFSRTFSYC